MPWFITAIDEFIRKLVSTKLSEETQIMIRIAAMLVIAGVYIFICTMSVLE